MINLGNKFVARKETWPIEFHPSATPPSHFLFVKLLAGRTPICPQFGSRFVKILVMTRRDRSLLLTRSGCEIRNLNFCATWMTGIFPFLLIKAERNNLIYSQNSLFL